LCRQKRSGWDVFAKQVGFALQVYDMGSAWGAPDEHYGQHSETWKLGVLFLACKTGLAVNPPNGCSFEGVKCDMALRVPFTVLLTEDELELMEACFADESVRQAPRDLKDSCSYFEDACYQQLPATRPLPWVESDDG
jgi:hypothetical protein